jgi:hypothetical protein
MNAISGQFLKKIPSWPLLEKRNYARLKARNGGNFG